MMSIMDRFRSAQRAQTAGGGQPNRQGMPMGQEMFLQRPGLVTSMPVPTEVPGGVPKMGRIVDNNPPRDPGEMVSTMPVGNPMPFQPSFRSNPSPFGNSLNMGRFGGYNQPQPFMGGFGRPQMGYGSGFGYGMPQMPFMGGYGGGFGMQPRMPQMGYGGFGGFGMPRMGGYGNPFGQSFYGGLGSFMGQPSFPQQAYGRFGMPIDRGPRPILPRTPPSNRPPQGPEDPIMRTMPVMPPGGYPRFNPS